MADELAAELEAAFKTAHQKFADDNKHAARGCDWDAKAEMRAETVGHNVMMHEAILIVRAMLAARKSGQPS